MMTARIMTARMMTGRIGVSFNKAATGAVLLSLLLLAAACGGGGATGKPAKHGDDVIRTTDGKTVTEAAANKFKDAMDAMVAHDKADNWTAERCVSTADMFMTADSEQEGKFLEARYNAGGAYQRCRNDEKAKDIFKSILSDNPKFHRARVKVALYDFRATKDLDRAISEMKQAIKDAQFKNEEALVNVAMFMMLRDGPEGDSQCKNDFDCAKLNLQRALAINDSFMPAFNRLAIYYLESAQKKAGRKIKRRFRAAAGRRKKADSAALELAALVVSQALRKNPNYAPVHNTLGLISAELGDLSSAARSFGKARKLDPKLFEAQMNYAAVNLSFRGFAQAETAYRAALKLRPGDYEAVLGLALAARGQINDSNFDARVKEVEALLAKAQKIDPSRAETYFNQAIFTQAFKAQSGGDAGPQLIKAKNQFKDFVAKAKNKRAFAPAVKRAKERIDDIEQIIEFNKQTAKEQAIEEANRKRREAQELKNKAKKGE